MNDISPATIAPDDQAVVVAQPVFMPLASPHCAQVCAALAIAQGAFKTPKRTKEASVQGTTSRGQPYSYKYKYAPLEEIVEAVKEALSANGLARHQYLVSRGNQPVMRTIIWHASGEWIASDYPIHPTKEGAQGFASGVTYARRYGLSLALGLAPEDDDDANIADSNAPAPNHANANTNGRPQPQPVTKPMPAAPPPVGPVYDPETGETSPHRMGVPLTKGGKPNWVEWGGRLNAAFAHAQDKAELEEWKRENEDLIREAESTAPAVFKSVAANFRGVMKHFDEAPDFIEAS